MKSNLVKRILAMGLAVVLASADVLPAIAEELNTTEVVTEEVTTETSEVTTPSNEIVVEGNTAIVPVTEFAEAAASNQNDEVGGENEAEAPEEDSITADEGLAESLESKNAAETDVTGNDADEAEPITVFDVEQAGVHVVVTVSEAGALPADASLTVKEIEVTPSMEEAVSDALENVSTIKAYDITFYDAEGNEIEPTDKVSVSIFLPEVTEDCSVFHYDEEAEEVEDMEAVAVEGEVAFETDHFSTYLVVNKNVDSSKKSLNITEESDYVSVYTSVDDNVWNDGDINYGDIYVLKIKVYVDDELKNTFPANNSKYFNFKSIGNYSVASVNQNYVVDKVEYGTRTYNDSQSNPGLPVSWTTVADYRNFTPNFVLYRNSSKYNYSYIRIYLKSNTTKELGNDYIKVTSKKDYIEVSNTNNTDRFLTVNTYVSETDVPSTTPAATKVFKLAYSNSLEDVFAFSEIMDGYEINSAKFNGNAVAVNGNSLSLSGTANKKDVLDIYLTASDYYDGDSNIRVTLANYDPAKINVNGNVARDFKFGTSGDTNAAIWNRWLSADDKKVYTGIVKRNLNSNGFPLLAVGNSQNADLDYLFKKNTSGVTQLITGATGLLNEPDENGYYIFNSSEGSKRLEYKNGSYTNNVVPATNGTFAPFSAKSNDDNDKYYFGMKLETEFLQPVSGKVNGKPMKFEFSGDDDVWVFIDGRLVLDIGGLHDALSGSIDFSTGVVTRPDKSRSESGTIAPTTLRELYKSAYLEEYPNADAETVRTWLYGIFGDGDTFKDFSSHSLTMFYFERGAGKSNCMVKFNLPTISRKSTVAVSKKVTGKKEEDNGKYSFVMDYLDGNMQDESFELANGQTKEFVIPEGTKFTVRETNVEAAAVKIDDTICPVDTDKKEAVSTTYEASDVFKSIVFDNIFEGQYGDTVVTKTATCKNYDDRTYTINLSADYNGTKTVVSQTTTKKDADVVLVIDTSGSMIFTDVEVINASSASESFAQLNKLNKDKVYFTAPVSEYNNVAVNSSIIKKRLLDTAFNDSGKCRNIPKSGDYLYYSDGAWYKKNVDKIGKSDPLKDGTELKKDNCPTKIYTNRTEVMINAATDFIKKLTSDSRVAVVKFGAENKAEKLCDFTDNKTAAINALSKAKGKQATGTYPYYGLYEANGLFTNDNNPNANYTVFFTDGANDGDSITGISDKLKKQSQVYAIGIGENGSTLKTVATDNDHILTANGAESLAGLFSSVSSSIVAETTSFTGKGTVIDYIDPRFEVTDLGGGTKCTDSDGNIYIKWENVAIGHDDKKWKASITVRAKDNFFGGNAIPTNGAGSKVSIDGETPAFFPQPTVNVKELDYAFDYELSDFETTLLLGEESKATEYVKEINSSVKGKGLDTKDAEAITNLVKLSDDELETLIANYNDETKADSLDKDYIVNGEKIGTFTYVLAASDKSEKPLTKIANHDSDAVAKPYEKYSIKISFVPLTEAERLASNKNFVAPANGGTPVGNIEKAGTYIVNVAFEGKITLVKNINTSEVEWTDGDPIFTFKITNNSTKKSVYKTVHFTQADPREALTVEFTRLGAGEYTVEELPTLGYMYAGDLKKTTEYNNVIVAESGVASAQVTLSAACPEASLSLTNVKNPEYFMDRDEVLNDVTFDVDGKAIVSITNKTENKKFATKADLEAYVKGLNN